MDEEQHGIPMPAGPPPPQPPPAKKTRKPKERKGIAEGADGNSSSSAAVIEAPSANKTSRTGRVVHPSLLMLEQYLSKKL